MALRQLEASEESAYQTGVAPPPRGTMPPPAQQQVYQEESPDVETGLEGEIGQLIRKARDNGATEEDLASILSNRPDIMEQYGIQPASFEQAEGTPELGSVPEQTYEPSLPQLDYSGGTGTVQNMEGPVDFSSEAIPDEDPNPQVKFRNISDDAGAISYMEGDDEAEDGWWESPVQLARAIVDGLAFGWSDEAAAGIYAGLATLQKYTGGNDISYDEEYSRLLNQYQGQRDEYADAHPVANIAANIAGGIVSPANFLAPLAVGKAGAGLAKLGGNVLNKTTVPGKIIGQGTAQAAPRIGVEAGGKIATGAGIGTVEGAVAGAGSSRPGERMEGAESGAKWGAGIGGGVGALATGARRLSKNRMEQELGKGDDFIPMTHTSSTSIFARIYRRAIGSSIGGGAVVKAQGERLSRKAREGYSRLQEISTRKVAQAKGAVDNVNATAKTQREAAKDGTKRAIDEANATAGSRAAGRKLAQEAEDAATKAQATTKAAQEADNATKLYRRAILQDSQPVGMSAEERKLVMDSTTMESALEKLSQHWQRLGYNMIKDGKFEVDYRHIAKKLKAVLKKEDILLDNELSMVKEVVKSVKKTIKKELKQPEPEGLFPSSMSSLGEAEDVLVGTMSGDTLSKIRSALYRTASDIADSDPTKARIMRKLGGVFDDTIEGQLSGKALTDFKAEREAWRTFRTMRDAIKSATGKAGNTGEFSPNQYKTSLGKEGTSRQRGQGPHQKQTDKTADMVESTEKMLQDAATNKIAEGKAALIKSNQLDAADLQKQINGLNAELDEANRVIGANQAQQTKYAAKASELAELEQELTQAKARVKSLESLEPTDASQSGITSLIITAMLGLGNPIAGVPVSYLLATQRAQRIAAGQTRAQKWLDKNLVHFLDGDQSTYKVGGKSMTEPFGNRLKTRAATRAGILESNTGVPYAPPE